MQGIDKLPEPMTIRNCRSEIWEVRRILWERRCSLREGQRSRKTTAGERAEPPTVPICSRSALARTRAGAGRSVAIGGSWGSVGERRTARRNGSRHLRSCEACRAEYDVRVKVAREFRQLAVPKSELPSGLASFEVVRARVEERQDLRGWIAALPEQRMPDNVQERIRRESFPVSIRRPFLPTLVRRAAPWVAAAALLGLSLPMWWPGSAESGIDETSANLDWGRPLIAADSRLVFVDVNSHRASAATRPWRDAWQELRAGVEGGAPWTGAQTNRRTWLLVGLLGITALTFVLVGGSGAWTGDEDEVRILWRYREHAITAQRRVEVYSDGQLDRTYEDLVESAGDGRAFRCTLERLDGLTLDQWLEAGGDNEFDAVQRSLDAGGGVPSARTRSLPAPEKGPTGTELPHPHGEVGRRLRSPRGSCRVVPPRAADAAVRNGLLATRAERRAGSRGPAPRPGRVRPGFRWRRRSALPHAADQSSVGVPPGASGPQHGAHRTRALPQARGSRAARA